MIDDVEVVETEDGKTKLLPIVYRTLDDFGFKNPLIELDREQRFFVKGEKMKMKVNPVVDFKDGVHNGKIVGIDYRDKPFDYTDIEIEEKETKLKMKVGYPTFISKNSKLGQLMERFGIELVDDADVDVDDLIGKECSFQTAHNKGKDGKERCIIIDSTVKSL